MGDERGSEVVLPPGTPAYLDTQPLPPREPLSATRLPGPPSTWGGTCLTTGVDPGSVGPSVATVTGHRPSVRRGTAVTPVTTSVESGFHGPSVPTTVTQGKVGPSVLSVDGHRPLVPSNTNVAGVDPSLPEAPLSPPPTYLAGGGGWGHEVRPEAPGTSHKPRVDPVRPNSESKGCNMLLLFTPENVLG